MFTLHRKNTIESTPLYVIKPQFASVRYLSHMEREVSMPAEPKQSIITAKRLSLRTLNKSKTLVLKRFMNGPVREEIA
jgi:hypothetical protein